MEKDDEHTQGKYNFGARFYDSRLVRWFSIHPVFQPWQSPYNSMDGNPINLNDVLGDCTDGSCDDLKAPDGSPANLPDGATNVKVTGESPLVKMENGEYTIVEPKSIAQFQVDGSTFNAKFDSETGEFTGYKNDDGQSPEEYAADLEETVAYFEQQEEAVNKEIDEEFNRMNSFTRTGDLSIDTHKSEIAEFWTNAAAVSIGGTIAAPVVAEVAAVLIIEVAPILISSTIRLAPRLVSTTSLKTIAYKSALSAAVDFALNDGEVNVTGSLADGVFYPGASDVFGSALEFTYDFKSLNFRNKSIFNGKSTVHVASDATIGYFMGRFSKGANGVTNDLLIEGTTKFIQKEAGNKISN